MPLPTDDQALDEVRARLALWRIPGVGPALFDALLALVPETRQWFALTPAQQQAWHVPLWLYHALKKPDWAGVDRDCRWLDQTDHHVLWAKTCALADGLLLPEALRMIPQAPSVVFVRGHAALLEAPQIAMVGSRHPSFYGLSVGFDLAAQAAALGWVITSGLALGIDSQCQRGALAVGGQSIGVLAVGLDRVYPKQHQALAEQLLAAQGALVSEWPIGVEARPHYFPRCNRLISGLSKAVVVIEAALKSGSLITAQYALEQGRDVFAVPGSIRSKHCQGCHALIKQGAYLLDQVADLAQILTPGCVSEVVPSPSRAAKSPLTPAEQQFLTLFQYGPLDNCALQAKTAMSVEQLSVVLTNLMLKGYLMEDQGSFSVVFDPKI